MTEYTTPLRDPSQPESLDNYHICGETTKAGTPCGARRQWNYEEQHDEPCAQHLPMNIKAKKAERAAQLRAEQQAREEAYERSMAEAWKTAGSELRTGLVESMKSAYLTSVLSETFTVINLKTGRFATRPADKRRMLAKCPSQVRFIVVWEGQWTNDAFLTTAGELKGVLG